MLHSAVLIIPAALKAQADQLGAVMGWGDVSYTIALTSDADEITHFAARADVTVGFIEAFHALKSGTMPDDPGPTLAALLQIPAAFRDQVIAALHADFADDPAAEEHARHSLWGRAHLDAVLATQELQLMA